MDMQTVIEELRRRGRNMVALDTPQKQDLADVGADFAAGVIPVLAQAQALRDFERSRRAQDPAGMAMASAGLIPFGKLLTAALRRSNPVISQIDVYHGTPHRFPATEANPLGEFDASKIGTGEVIGEMLGPTRGKTPVANWNADKTVPASSIVELHGVRDKKKRDALQADMELRGWSGRPVLAYRDDSGAVFALTGSHRIAAARAADIDVPIVLVSDASMQQVDEIGRYLPEIAGKDDNDLLQFFENAGDKRSAELMRLEVRSNNENNVMETRNFAEFPGEEKKVKILERK